MSYVEDNFPTAGIWETTQANSSKQWPTSKNPAQVTVKQNRPAFQNYSHNGRKFTRRTSFAKWQLEVEYSALTDAELTEMHAVALAAQGQYQPFQFDVDYLFQYNKNKGTSFRNVNQINPGDQTITVGNLVPSRLDTFIKGEIIEIPNRNGNVNIVLANADTDGNGQTTIRLAYPATKTIAANTSLYKNVQRCTVTLANNGFDYVVDTNGFYYVTVTFDLDEWK